VSTGERGSRGRLAGRHAIVTGGSRGIGAAIVRAFVEEGCAVAFCHLDDAESAGMLINVLRADGHDVHATACDVSDEASVGRFVAWAREQFGAIDILVNNAGIGGEAAFDAIGTVLFDRMIAVHLRGTFLMAHACYPDMRQRGHGRIINMASQLAYLGAAGAVHYCAAKAGIIGLTRALAREAAPHGVLVNAIAPGPIDTDLLGQMSPAWLERKRSELPLGRFGRPDEIALTAVLLASEGGAFYVGQTLSPNGGDVMI
jgi:3-oxoacyl-[acyl-carrier protein] reductase